MTESALKEVGVKEATNSNDGERVETYLHSVHLNKGDYWCAAFLGFIYQCCNIKNPLSGYCPSWFPKSHTIYDRRNKTNQVPQSGDVFGIYHKEQNRVAHVGIIIIWGKEVTTVEGNSNESGNSRNGDGVHKKYRDASAIYQVSSWL